LRLYCTRGTWSQYGDDIQSTSPRVVPLLVDGDTEVDPEAIDVACLSGDAWPDLITPFMRAAVAAPNLRWFHSFSAGVDHPVFASFVRRGVLLTNSPGAAARPIAHSVIMLLLALSRDLPGWVRAQDDRRWQQHFFDDIDGTVLGVVGMGPIGLEVGRAAQALGIDVIGCRRTPQPGDPWPTFASVAEVAPHVDWLVLAAPLTDETRHMVDAGVLTSMRPTARLINVGRGDLVDEDALVDALRDGVIAGAALDVFAIEPLPPEHALWTMPNVIVTPHSTGRSSGSDRRAMTIFLDNLARLEADRPLTHVVRDL
jgi:phosphoglycerate dehydrogenase-like enzyme